MRVGVSGEVILADLPFIIGTMEETCYILEVLFDGTRGEEL